MGKRLRSQRRGKGSVWQSPSHRHKGAIKYPQVREMAGTVVDIFHDPGHGSPVAKIMLENGRLMNMLPPEGLHVDQKIRIGPNVKAYPGNITVLREEFGVEKRIEIDYKKLVAGDPSQENIRLRPGDTVLVK